MTDIAGHEDAWNAGLEVERIAVGSPSGGALAVEYQMLAGDQVPLRITLDDSRQPVCPGNSARVNQQRTGGHAFRRTGVVVLDGGLLAVVHALDAGNAGV